ncbi:VTC domain-containing protein [Streptomyces poriferorum]|nr:VTC domain-containing protein [Streptomyces sp. Alt1]WLQ53536.1 VTC domain-containing protein [Streptomyces sp. Alt1]
MHVASRLHAFNRYELKYLVPVDLAAELRDELGERMDRDLNSPAGGYGVWSLYYDSPELRFYWEKIEGLKFRRKLRIRHYGEPDGVSDASPVCVEIKQRVNRVTQKRRITLPYGTARQLCDGRELVEHSPKERAFIHEVLDLVVRLNLRPTAITGYQREALVGRGSDTGLRVTFDRRIRGDALDVVETLGDPHQLAQVIANLLANACVHTPPEARVEVRVGTVRTGPDTGGTDRPGRSSATGALPPDIPACVVEIADDGPGLPADTARQVFERFYRGPATGASGREPGSGLGLSIASTIAEAHRGRLELDTRPGAGAIFRLLLPRSVGAGPATRP